MTFAFEKKQHLSQREAIAALSSRGKVLFKYPIKAYWLPTGGADCQQSVVDAACGRSAGTKCPQAGEGTTSGRSAAADGTVSAAVVGAHKSAATPGCPRYVFSVPKREFKRAVKRNLLKRRMREAVRLNQAECLGDFCADYLLVYISKEICDYSVIEAAVRDILSKSRKLDPTFGSELRKGKPAVNTPHQ